MLSSSGNKLRSVKSIDQENRSRHVGMMDLNGPAEELIHCVGHCSVRTTQGLDPTLSSKINNTAQRQGSRAASSKTKRGLILESTTGKTLSFTSRGI